MLTSGKRIYNLFSYFIVYFALASLSSKEIYAVNLGGTPPRVEIESKYAFMVEEHFDDLAFTSAIHNRLRIILNSFKFGEVGLCKINLDPSPLSFAFLDYYYDTDDLAVLNRSSAFRLRLRWNSFLSYVRFKLYPFSKLFRPTRTEIQAKIDYKNIGGALSTNESRFEFRKESHPFNDGVELPPVNWTVQDFSEIIKSGKFADYYIYPAYSVKQIGIDTNQLKHKLTLLTKRNRMHLNCKSPFGSGPNPDQLFIVTVDLVFCEYGCSNKYSRIVEVEIERERNTSTVIDRISSYGSGGYFSNSSVAEEAIGYSKIAKHYFDSDFELLSKAIESEILERNLNVLPSNFKYSRFLQR